MPSSEREVRSARSTLVVLGVLFLLLPTVVVAACVLPSPAALMAPGPVEPVEPLIRVEGTSYEPEGHLYLTTVRLALEPRLGQYVLARLQPDVEAVAKTEVMPAGLSREEFQKLGQRLLGESQSIAQVVALREAGYDVQVGDPEVEVIAILPGSPAASRLRVGDRIEAVNGESIDTAAELVNLIQSCVTGEPVSLRIRRDGEMVTVTIPSLRGPLDNQGPVLGVVALTTGFDYRSPVDVRIESGRVTGGSSAGLVYALGVYNALVTEDITRGRKIAGTGTIRLNGTVGPVGGVKLKVRAAEDAGAEYFLVAAEDAAAARAAARDMKVLPVRSFQEALAALRQIGSESGPGPRVVPASGDVTLARGPWPRPTAAWAAAAIDAGPHQGR